MKDNDCVQFLQWALPQLQLRWPGFRKVRGQVCKRIARRLRQLDMADISAYQAFLLEHHQEWSVFDELARITISRFYRDKAVFDFLSREVLPELAQRARMRRAGDLKLWSAGCASGEEAYTLSLIWRLQLQSHYPDIAISITATDASADMIARAQQGCYTYSSIKNLPPQWRELDFTKQAARYCLKSEFRRCVRLMQLDIRQHSPGDSYDLVVCRNLVFTYFDTALQCRVLERILQALKPGGVLLIGSHENLPPCSEQFRTWSDKHKIYQKLEIVSS
jgi:chemotaxis protein methyltransferase CheR